MTADRFMTITTSSILAMVIDLERRCSMHEHPIGEEAADWLLEDLRDDPDALTGKSDDLGPVYEMAVSIFRIIKADRPKRELAKDLARQIVFHGLSQPVPRDEGPAF